MAASADNGGFSIATRDRVKFSELFSPFNSWREGTTVVLAINNDELLANMSVMKLRPALTASAAESFGKGERGCW